MTPTNSLPLIVKRVFTVFLIWGNAILLQSFSQGDIPPDEIKNTVSTVVIDPGHGGKDSGAIGKISKEKDLALKISLKLGKLIEENIPDVDVHYTRKTDIFPGLNERAEIANKLEADLFISIHVNASTKSSPYGTSSHVLGLHRKDQHFDVAVRENSVILLEEDYETKYQGFDPMSEESYIIFSLMQKTYLGQSIEFASYVQDEFRDRAKRNDRGVVQQGLQVLAITSMPAVLIETGFITNPEEEKFLNTDYGQDLIASAIYRAFKEYKYNIEDRSHFERKLPAENNLSQKGTKVSFDKEPSLINNTLEFRVQIAASKILVDTSPSSFKGHKDVSVLQQGSKYKYTVGKDLDYHEALNKCSSVKNDFPGAFVIAVKNEKIIPLNDALLEINR